MSNDAIVIVNGARTPMGGFQGALKDVSAPDLGAAAIKAAVERAGVSADSVDEVIMGCILTAGLGQGPARQAMRKAGLPDSTSAVTINKLCGSGLKAVMEAYNGIKAGFMKPFLQDDTLDKQNSLDSSSAISLGICPGARLSRSSTLSGWPCAIP